jgi:hypothetical protein
VPFNSYPLLCILTQVATAQILKRLNLDWLARDKSNIRQKPKTGHYTFLAVFIVLVVYYTLFYATVIVSQFIPWTKDLLVIWAALLMCYTVFVVAKAREQIRRRDRIPQRTVSCGMEDCCCALCCTWCVVAQMARHTANLKRLPCCPSNSRNRNDEEEEQEYDISSCLSTNGLWKPTSRRRAPHEGNGDGSPLHEPLLGADRTVGSGDGSASPRRRKGEQMCV